MEGTIHREEKVHKAWKRVAMGRERRGYEKGLGQDSMSWDRVVRPSPGWRGWWREVEGAKLPRSTWKALLSLGR